jgi:hypothetical protein
MFLEMNELKCKMSIESHCHLSQKGRNLSETENKHQNNSEMNDM